MTQRIITADEATCQCDRAPAWCFMHRRWGRVMSSPPTRAELEEKALGLSATVVAQAAEIERLTRELAALRAIIDGRTTPPTDEEIEAHHRAGGTWYVASTHGRALTTTRADAVALCAHLAANKYPATWWAISVRGRPCAWPVVAEASR